ncbi:MurR/RpiR family transcriptional regulator [Sanguibacter sp. 25GB23B1]|uniref:MurR/RpiR family transcriptional regulator n=1 Tax=Sanguibacter sp. 25GB23B1 TaxID=3156067 RepID=UPI0032AF1253
MSTTLGAAGPGRGPEQGPTEAEPGPDVWPSVRIATVRNALQPTERRVVDLVLEDVAAAIEATAQDIADRAGVARSSVIRTCQRLGYRGYPQLRVALARELAVNAEPSAHPDTALGRVRTHVESLAATLQQITSVLDDERVEQAVALCVGAGRVVATGNGLSSPLAADLALRMTAGGRPTEFVADPIGQQIAAAQLTPADLCLVVSGSGANESSLKVARAGRAAGVPVVVLTSFVESPLTALADVALVVGPAAGSFRAELEHTSRVPHAIVLEALVEVVADRLGERSRQVRSRVLDVLSNNLSD